MREFLHFYFGYVKIEIREGSKERFLNLLLIHGIKIWDLEKTKDKCTFCILIQDFRKLPEYVRKTKVRVHILKKCGRPFVVYKVITNLSFYLGFLLCISFISWTMGNVNHIEYNGNVTITDNELSDFLTENRVRIGNRINELHLEALEESLLIKHPDIIWTSMEIDGTILKIHVKEIEKTEKDSADETQPGDLISEYDGIVHSIITRRGTPLVKAGDSVSSGDILVTGIVPVYDDSQTVKELEYVRADADVIIEHDVDVQMGVLKTQSEKKYTGRKQYDYEISLNQKKTVIRMFDRCFLYQDTITSPIHFGESFWLLHNIIINKKEYLEYYYYENLITTEQAKEMLLYELINFILSLEDKGVQIIEKNVKIINDTDLFLLSGSIRVLENSIRIININQ